MDQFSDRSIRESLRRVGRDKMIGYLPLYTIADVLGVNPDRLARRARSRGLSARLIGPDECRIESGALYVYDAPALMRMPARFVQRSPIERLLDRTGRVHRRDRADVVR